LYWHNIPGQRPCIDTTAGGLSLGVPEHRLNEAIQAMIAEVL
jgi:hypothetical protein